MHPKTLIFCWRFIPQGLYLAEVLSRAGFKVTYCTNEQPLAWNGINLDNITFRIIPIPSALKKRKIHNLINWIYGFVYGLLSHNDIVIGIDNQGYVPAGLIKLITSKKFVVGYFLEYNAPEESKHSLATKLTALMGNYCDTLIDVEKHRLNLRKGWMNYNGSSFIICNTPLYFDHNISTKPNKKRKELRVLYSGQIGKANCIEDLLEAINIADIPLNLTLIGNASPIYINELKKKYYQLFNSGKVKYDGFIKRQHLYDYFNKSDIGIVFYLQSHGSNETYCAPNKLYEYISYGLPLLCSDNQSLDFVEEEKIGYQVNTSNIEMIRDKLVTFYKEKDILIKMKNNCNAIFTNKYNYEKQSEPFIKYLKLCVQSSKIPLKFIL
jgi:glycosyltransferase involved in cell wall biosynthesis